MATAISSIASATQAPIENFAALFEESLTRQEMRQGELITAEVVRVDFNIVVVNAGLKSESAIPLEEFLDSCPTVSREQAGAALEAAHEAVSARAHSGR